MFDPIDEIRLKSMGKQIQAIQKVQSRNPVNQYLSRDSETGLLQLKSADGGTHYGSFLSNSAPVSPIKNYDRVQRTINQAPANEQPKQGIFT